VDVGRAKHDALLEQARTCASQPRTYAGGCHCRDVAFRFTFPELFVAMDCDCSVCSMRGYLHVEVPVGQVTLLPDEEAYRASTTLYQFNTMAARHTFCKRCGVQPIYSRRTRPDCYAINLRCVQAENLPSMVPIVPHDGRALSGEDSDRGAKLETSQSGTSVD
jgi:hypothetical protein